MTVKNQFVIRADGVDLGQRNFLVTRHAAQHFEASFFFAGVPRRGGQIKNQLRALRDEFAHRIAPVNPFRPEIFVVPDVLANGDADFPTLKNKRFNLRRRFKIAVFVKHVVSGQQTFGRAPDDFSVLQNGGGVLQCATGTRGILFDVAEAKRNFANRFGGFSERGEVGGHKIFAQE